MYGASRGWLAAVSDVPARDPATAVVVEACELDDRSDLPPVEVTQLRQLRTSAYLPVLSTPRTVCSSDARVATPRRPPIS
jgi:hypothetical protein